MNDFDSSPYVWPCKRGLLALLSLPTTATETEYRAAWDRRVKPLLGKASGALPAEPFDLPLPNAGILLLLDLPADATHTEVSNAWSSKVQLRAAAYFRTSISERFLAVVDAMAAKTSQRWNVCWNQSKATAYALFQRLDNKQPSGPPWIGPQLAERLMPKA